VPWLKFLNPFSVYHRSPKTTLDLDFYPMLRLPLGAKLSKVIKKNGLYYPLKSFRKKAWLKDDSIYQEASKDPIKFWEKLAEELIWFKKWNKGFEFQPENFKWFVGGQVNITHNIFEKNKGDKIALIWEPEPVEEKTRKITFKELLQAVNRLANALKKLGVKKGEPVTIYLPMIPETAIAMLACARIGAPHSVVFSAFSPQALRVRLQDTQAKVLITADGYYRRGKTVNLKNNADEAIKETKVKKVIVVKRANLPAGKAGNEINWDEKRDIWYQELVKNESDQCQPELMDSEDTLFILYTSGSTGRPKGCVHTCGGYTVQALWTGKWIFDWHEDDVFWCTADVGWVTGHTYGVYSPLLNGIPTLFFEGAPDWPKPDRWADVIDEHKVTTFYTAPTAIRMFEKYGTDIIRNHRLSTLRLLGSVGEPIDEAAWEWYFEEIGKKRCPLVDTWWQTETGGILITSLPGIGPLKPAYTGLPFPGLNFDILDDQGQSLPTEKEGNLVLRQPFSPGLLRGVYHNPEKYHQTYWSQYGPEIYFTSDKAFKDKNGLIRIVGRADDVIKVAGHRLTTGELEAAINLHPDIIECAVIGIPDEIKGQVPVAFIISKTKRPANELKEEAIGYVRKEIGPTAKPKEVYLVEALPKTRSGKIMRRILRRLFTAEKLGDLSTLANPESVEKIKKEIEIKVKFSG
jgi:acetyl-CoA synthetase